MSPQRALAGMRLLVVLVVLAQGGSIACKSKKASPSPVPIAGLAAMPSDVQVVVGIDATKLRDSWLVERAVAQMFRRDPELQGRFRALIDACHFDPSKDLASILIGLGRVGEADEAVLVATGAFVEADLAACIGQSVAAEGGALETEISAGRTLYQTTGPRGGVWFAMAAPRTLVVATSSAWLARAIDPGDTVTASKAMAALLGRVDQGASFWGVGMIDERVGAGLVTLTQSKIAAPPAAVFGQIELEAGANLLLGAVMSSDNDANSLVSMIKAQKSLAVLALQRSGLSMLANKLGVDSESKTVYLRLSLSEGELKDALARIDTTTGSQQDPAAQ